jgi:uncharacterized RDD family membrane protein YckC
LAADLLLDWAVARTSQVTIETPEHFELTFTLAGLGGRFIAYLIDKSIQVGLILFLFLALRGLAFLSDYVGAVNAAITAIQKVLAPWVVSIVILMYGIISIGYFIIFEYFWSGFTPGKKLLKIRVMRNDGRPITLLESLIRNVLRVVDVLGEAYPIGAISMLIDSRCRRLGDFAAGTLVIVDTSLEKLQLAPTMNLLAESDEEMRELAMGMTREDFRIISRFMNRRQDLEPEYRMKLATDIVRNIRTRMGFTGPSKLAPERILEKLQRLYMQKTRIL